MIVKNWNVNQYCKTADINSYNELISEILPEEERVINRRITLRRSEDKLVRSEKMFQAVVESALNGIVMIDQAGIITLWNNAAEKIFGYSEKEAIGKPVCDIIVPEKYRQSVNIFFQKFAKSGKGKFIGKTIERDAVHKDGILFPVELSISAIMLENKRYVLAIIHDITKRIAFQNTIKDSEERFRLLNENLYVGVYIIQDDLFRYVNSAFGKLFGYDVSDIIDKLGPSDFIISEDRALLKKNMLDRFSGRIKTRNDFFRYLHKDGRLIEFETWESATHYKGRPAIIGTVVDITERRKKERNLYKKRIRAERSIVQFKKLAYSDGLTSIYNRRMFDGMIGTEFNRAKRNGTSLAFVMIDIDLFKGYNDSYGHLAGDRCLRKIAVTLKDSLFRAGDFVARYGGEEFAVILPDAKLNGALMIAKRMKANVEALHIPYSGSPISKWATISLGAASIVPHQGLRSKDLIKMADIALYKAKNNGRNRVELFQESAER